jgi:hypothetical protein
MGRETKQSPVDIAAAPEEVQHFARSRNRIDGPSVEDFRLDLATSALSSAWNKHAAKVFARSFIQTGWYSCDDEDFIRETFRTHLITLRKQYRDFLAEDDDNESDAMDALDRQRAKAREQRRRNVSKHCFFLCYAKIGLQLYNRRREACNVSPDLRRFVPLWDTLSFEAMSGDETDHAGRSDPRYAITRLPWRSTAVECFLRTFDKLHLVTRFTVTGRARRGAFPHHRISSKRVENHWKPVAGLPINFYDQAWLETIDDYERQDLKAKPQLDLTFTPSILR